MSTNESIKPNVPLKSGAREVFLRHEKTNSDGIAKREFQKEKTIPRGVFCRRQKTTNPKKRSRRETSENTSAKPKCKQGLKLKNRQKGGF
ncbi:hypothetical protein [Bdellovibrio bacteriovorus]|uniref:hypothetical protein n=1 Tax=Bdellovibrio bacteriovorus TaxID=959 RepID=UPI0035A64410